MDDPLYSAYAEAFKEATKARQRFTYTPLVHASPVCSQQQDAVPSSGWFSVFSIIFNTAWNIISWAGTLALVVLLIFAAWNAFYNITRLLRPTPEDQAERELEPFPHPRLPNRGQLPQRRPAGDIHYYPEDEPEPYVVPPRPSAIQRESIYFRNDFAPRVGLHFNHIFNRLWYNPFRDWCRRVWWHFNHRPIFLWIFVGGFASLFIGNVLWRSIPKTYRQETLIPILQSPALPFYAKEAAAREDLPAYRPPGWLWHACRWIDSIYDVPVGGDPAFEFLTTTVYKDAGNRAWTTSTVTETQEKERLVTKTRWATVMQSTTETVYTGDGEPSTVTSTRWGTVNVPTTITIGEPYMSNHTVTSFITQQEIIANVTPTTIYSVTHSVLTKWLQKTETLPASTATSTVTVEQPVERGAGLPFHYHDREPEVRREVDGEGKVWCKTCRQWHCCQLPY